jgi:hypothetical protein
MEILNLIDKETLSKLPLIFQTLKASSVEGIEKADRRRKNRFISIDFYQTIAFTPYSLYKPISQIFKIYDNKPK